MCRFRCVIALTRESPSFVRVSLATNTLSTLSDMFTEKVLFFMFRSNLNVLLRKRLTIIFWQIRAHNAYGFCMESCANIEIDILQMSEAE